MILTNTRFRRRPSNSPQKIRSHVPKSSRPLVTATTTSRPITRNTASCVPLQVRIGVVFTGAIVLVLADGGMRGQPFQPLFMVGVQTSFVIMSDCEIGSRYSSTYSDKE